MKSIFICGLPKNIYSCKLLQLKEKLQYLVSIHLWITKKYIFTCEICSDVKSLKNIFKNKNRCAHSICSDCIGKHIIAKLEDNVAEIKCPKWLSCKQLLDHHTCHKIIPYSQFAKWCLCILAIKLSETDYCRQDHDRMHCSLMVNESESIVKRSECPKWKKLFFSRCIVSRLECNNHQRIEKNDKIFMELAESMGWIKCPTCNYYIERISGCNTMKCRFDLSFFSHWHDTLFDYIILSCIN